MLTTLRIKNLALVADLTVEFTSGYNAITGETGAGKSILIGALNLVLGERADRTLIRSGAESCSVEAVFDVARLRAPLRPFLDENGLEPCDGGQLVLKRNFTTAGTNRQFVNGSPTTLQTLAAIGEWLVDIHGPHEHQSLIHPAKQLGILDAFGNLRVLRDEFTELARRREALLAEKAGLIVDEQTYARQVDLLRFQVKEITAAHLHQDEDAQIEQRHRRASNAAKLHQLARASLGLVSEEDGSLFSNSGVLGRTLQELKALDPGTAPLLTLQEQCVASLQELQRALSDYEERLEIDPGELQQLEDRLNLIHSLKRKYGKTLAGVMAFAQEAQRNLESLEQRDAELSRLNLDLKRIETALQRAGQSLSDQRRSVIPNLKKAVASQLADLGFTQSQFDVAISSESGLAHIQSPMPWSGLDTVEFQFAPNLGEPARPLRAIASSGEMARVMLALKTVLAAEDDIPVLVFDEVDANVGGETAKTVGLKMRQIAKKHQVLCITHLAPVAAPADAHFLVSKQISGGRTLSEVTLLDKKGRTGELARMLGEQSAAARHLAEALLQPEKQPPVV